MSVTGVNSNLRDLLAARLDQTLARPVDEQPRAAGSAAHAGAPTTTGVSTKTARPSGGLTPQAPAGTDPALWSILTGEERAFFANHADSGPLTYSRVMMPNRSTASAMPSIRGGRVDVKV